MSETISSAQRPAGAADLARNERLRPVLVAGGIVLALALAVVLLRLQRLTEFPPGLMLDEGAHGVDAFQVLQGKHAVFFPDNNGREGLIVYAIALATSLLGPTMLALRLPTALASAGTVFVVFWLGQLLFGRDEESGRATPWRGLLVGGVGAGLLAVSLGQTILGRTAYRANFLPLLLSLCLALLWRGWRQRSWWQVALSGACAGLLPYTYIAARFTPFLFLFFALSFLLPCGRSKDRGERSERGSLYPYFPFLSSRLWDGPLKRNLPWVGLFLGVAGLVAAPILVYFTLHPEHFFMRSSQLSVFHPTHSQGDPLGTFLGNVWEHLLVFGFRGDRYWEHNFPGQSMLTLWEVFFFWLGVGMAVWRWQRRPAYRLLLLWLGALLLPAMLAKDIFVPNTLRMIGAAPAIYLLVAVGVWEVFRFLRERVFREDETKTAIAVGAVVSGLILVQGVSAYRTYFQKWAVAPEVHWVYKAEWPDLIRTLHAQPPHTDIVYLIPDGHRLAGLWEGFQSYTFEYLYQGAAPAHLFHPNTPNLAQKIESTLAAMKNISTVKVVEWKTNLVGTVDETERIAVLLSKYGRYLGSDKYDSFEIHTYTDISLDRPWTYYDHLEPPTVQYDGDIALQGFALGQGEKQLSTQQLLNLRAGRSLWMALQWQTAPGLDIDYAVSVRLYNAEGGGVYQFIKDTALWKPDHTPTGSGGPSELFDTLVQLDLPAEFLPGEYELRLVVYNTKTLAPTVQVGVWEPEVTLARLRLAEIK